MSSKSQFHEKKVFPATFESLDEIHKFIKQACRAARLDDKATYNVLLSVSEACSNIIEHAYDESENGTIDCDCVVTTEDLKILFHDEGHGFDPSMVPAPDIDSTLENRLKGGLGLYFIRQLMDEVKFGPVTADTFGYQKDHEGNYLLLIKHRESEK